MRRKTMLLRIVFLILFLFLTGCSQNNDGNSPTPSEPGGTSTDLMQVTVEQSPTVTLISTETATSTPEPTSTRTSTPTPTPPCTPQLCTYPGHFWLERPIAPSDNDQVDSSYRYGSTQEGARPTHHGVEFVNEEGTPVLAAAEGFVVVAGNDFQETYADYPFYYGNLVIIEHNFPEIDKPVLTLYGHLSEVKTQVGTLVQVGDQIGSVGYTGIAEWSHLHFEVRVGENRFNNTRNPELWLKPHQNENGQTNGAIAGRIIDEFGTPIYIPNIVIEKIGPSDEVIETLYIETYADFTVFGDDVWQENFAAGDLTPGKYRVTFVARGIQEWDVEVYPGQLTLLVFDASKN
jgi:murein DD-endopeptidase MepM/ murein hydrolase activator NlpD